MEDLTKQQIVLVTLLVSFVTSIATGIVTVALMDQAPPGVTQTINRVVERTIEKAVQVPSAAAVVTKETVIVNADDATVSAIAANANVVVRITPNYPDAPTTASGIVVSKDGLILTDRNLLNTDLEYFGHFADGTVRPLEFVSSTGNRSIALFRAKPVKDETLLLPSAKLGNSSGVKLGQTVILLSGREENSVGTGLVAHLSYTEPDNASSTPELYSIDTTVTPKDGAGGILVNLSAEVVGLWVSGERGHFLPSNVLALVRPLAVTTQ